MPAITEDHLIESIADALQYISYYHPADFVQAMTAAWEREENKGARDAMAQILVNSRMCAVGHRPICQDTGAANIHIKVGVEAPLALKRSLQEIADEGTRRGYLRDTNPLRASVVVDPFGERKNSGDNTPCMLTVEMVAGDKIDVEVAAKGGGWSRFPELDVMPEGRQGITSLRRRPVAAATSGSLSRQPNCGAAGRGRPCSTRSTWR